MSLARTMSWINIRYGWRIFFWAGFLALLAALLDVSPLFNLLGYDFSFAMGLAAALAGVDIGHGTVANGRRAERALSPARAAGEAVVATWAVLALPLVLSLLNALRVRNCNLQAGLAFFALLPVCTGAYAAGTGSVVASFVRGRSGRALAFALPFVSVAWALWRLYCDPAVFAFDPFAGYFPGPIYDEALRPHMQLVWYRLANATWLAAAIATTDWLCRGSTEPQLQLEHDLLKPRLALVVLLLGGSLAWYEARGDLGFHIRRADLAKILPRETRSAHFVLRSDRAAESDADIALAMQDLEFRYFQLEKVLGVEPHLPVRVYRFPSAAAKKDAVGAANTLFARPWSSEIFVQAAFQRNGCATSSGMCSHRPSVIPCSAFRWPGIFTALFRGQRWLAASSKDSLKRPTSTIPMAAPPHTKQRLPCSRTALRRICAARSAAASRSNRVRVLTRSSAHSAAIYLKRTVRKNCALSTGRPAISIVSTATICPRSSPSGGPFSRACPPTRTVARKPKKASDDRRFSRKFARESSRRVSRKRTRSGPLRPPMPSRYLLARAPTILASHRSASIWQKRRWQPDKASRRWQPLPRHAPPEH